MLYSDNNSMQSTAEVTNDLSKCCIKEVERPQADRSSAIASTRFPSQAPQNIQGAAARPGKVVGSAMRYNNCGVAVTAEIVEQRRAVRNPSVTAQYAASSCSYPRRNPNYKSEREEDDDRIEGSNGLQPNPQYMARKVAAAQGGAGGQWY